MYQNSYINANKNQHLNVFCTRTCSRTKFLYTIFFTRLHTHTHSLSLSFIILSLTYMHANVNYIQDLIMCGCSDVWSAVRGACVTRLPPLLSCFPVDLLEILFQSMFIVGFSSSSSFSPRMQMSVVVFIFLSIPILLASSHHLI